MEQFLCNAYEGTISEILQLNRDKNFDDKKAVALVSQLGVIGMLKDLPLILQALKAQFDQVTEIKNKQREQAIDPLAEEI